MARPQKEGLDYFPLDTGLFEDNSMKVVKGKYGTQGILLYVYLLCSVYKDKGYFLPYNDDINCIASSELNMDTGQVKKMVDFLCEKELFDSKLFKDEKILTSKGIQKRFQFAIKSRAARRKIPIVDKYWLLDAEDTNSFISFSEENGGFSHEKYPKENKRKENKNILYKTNRKNSFQDYDDEVTDFDIEIIRKRCEKINKRGDLND